MEFISFESIPRVLKHPILTNHKLFNPTVLMFLQKVNVYSLKLGYISLSEFYVTLFYTARLHSVMCTNCHI